VCGGLYSKCVRYVIFFCWWWDCTCLVRLCVAVRVCVWGALKCIAVRCSVLQCVAVCCSVLQCATVCCSVLLCVFDAFAGRSACVHVRCVTA